MVQHPNWSKCANGFEVDHVFPVKAFLDYGITDPKIVNALENLRPLPPKENHRKNRYYDKNEFEQYLHDRNITWKKN